MFRKQTLDDIATSREGAVEKAKRDAFAAEHGGTPEDAHSRAFKKAMAEGLNEKQCHEVAAQALAASKKRAAEKPEEKK